jgi:hypothetical protein
VPAALKNKRALWQNIFMEKFFSVGEEGCPPEFESLKWQIELLGKEAEGFRDHPSGRREIHQERM